MNKVLKNILFSGITVFILIIVIELSLSSYFLITSSNKIQKVSTKKKSEETRVMILGESTSSPEFYFHKLKAWPEVLEEKMKNKGFNIRFYNKSIPGQTTLNIIKNLSRDIEEVQPDYILAMIGVNDDSLSLTRNHHFLSKFSIYKVFKWYFQSAEEEKRKRICNLEISKDLIYLHSDEMKHIDYLEELRNQLESSVYTKDGILDLLNSEVDPERRMHKFVYASWLYQFELYRREMAIQIGTVGLEKYPKSLSIMHTLHDAYFSKKDYKNCTRILNYMSKMNAIRKNEWHWFKCLNGDSEITPETKKYLYCSNYEISNQSPYSLTKKRFRLIQKLAKDHNIKLGMISYPMSNHVALLEAFSDNNNYYDYPSSIIDFKGRFSGQAVKIENIFFINGSDKFRKLASQNGRDKYFMDSFHYPIGHLTKEGNEVLANIVAEELIKVLSPSR
jgi:hypothetical protein